MSRAAYLERNAHTNVVDADGHIFRKEENGLQEVLNSGTSRRKAQACVTG